MFQPHTFKMESISTLVCGRSIEENGYMIEESVWEIFTSGEGKGVIQSFSDKEPVKLCKGGRGSLIGPSKGPPPQQDIY